MSPLADSAAVAASITAWIGILLVVLIPGALVNREKQEPRPSPRRSGEFVPIPNLLGLTIPQAHDALAQVGLRLSIKPVGRISSEPAGTRFTSIDRG